MKLVQKNAYINGKIFTCNSNQPWAESVVTYGDKILFVGTNDGAAKFIDPGTELIDLTEKLMLPGFIDSHLHLMTGGFSLMNLDLGDVKSKKQFRNKVEQYLIKKNPCWIIGGNWDHYNFDEMNLPSKEWIDSITPDIPMFVTRSDLHMGLANSKALSLAGITKDTPNPVGGVIEKNVITGAPTGILIDNAMNIIFEIMPVPSVENCFEALNIAVNEVNKLGVTSVHDMVFPKDYTAYQEYMFDQKLTCRVYLVRPITDLENFVKLKIRRSMGNEFLKIGSLKAFADGSLGSSTAWFFEPYKDDPNFNGLPTELLENGKLRELALEADRNKLQLVIHAIGDRAISEILDIFEEIVNINPVWDRRFRIEHVQHIRKEDIPRMKKLNVIASMQPYHMYFDGIWCEEKIGVEKLTGTYAIKSLLDAGVKICFGSDWTVASPNPLLGTFAAVTRHLKGTKEGNGWISSERISVEEAIKCYTVNAAYASFEEEIKGSIEVGKLADMVVLSENIFKISADKIKNVRVDKTIFGGEMLSTD